jgi:hypothetical protein
VYEIVQADIGYVNLGVVEQIEIEMYVALVCRGILMSLISEGIYVDFIFSVRV